MLRKLSNKEKIAEKHLKLQHEVQWHGKDGRMKKTG